MRIFLAGAAGAIGRRLVPLLLQAGHKVTGTTRTAEKAHELERAGVVPAVLDVFDAGTVTASMRAAKPEVVIHQLTDLPREFDEALIAASYAKNARIRTEGTRNLIATAQAAGARRFIVQSIAFGYAPGAIRITRPIRSTLPTRRGGCRSKAPSTWSDRCSLLPVSRASFCAMAG